MSKYSYEQKLEVVQAYHKGKGEYKYLAKEYDISGTKQIREWVRNFEDYHGQEADLSIVCEKSSIYTLLCQDADTFFEEAEVTGDESWIYSLCENLSELPVSEGVTFAILTP